MCFQSASAAPDRSDPCKMNALKLTRSRGAITLMLAMSLFVLFGFMALAIDLGRTYVVRTELQNAADAAALAGAKELDQTYSGITKAIDRAIKMAQQNNYLFSTPVTITAANLAVGSCPDDECMTPIANITSDALAVGQSFLRVEVPSGNIATLFARLMLSSGPGVANTTTFGSAVAGRFVNNVTPLGLCALRDAATGASYPRNKVIEPTPGKKELVNFGFRRGVSYNIFDLGDIGGPSTPYLINPVDVYPNPCKAANSSANATAPFVCLGSSAVLTTTPSYVYGNTGISGGKMEAALNSRFNDYSGNTCDPVQAPPDTNVRAFGCTGAGCETPAADWMAQSKQSWDPKAFNPNTLLPSAAPPYNATPYHAAAKDDYGVLWSYSRAVAPIGTEPNLRPGPEYTTADWADLYPTLVGTPPAAGLTFPANDSPYVDPAHRTAPSGRTGQPDRRVMNMAIVDCGAATGSGSCKVLPVVGVGRFFMQTPAKVTGSGKAALNLEFAGLIEPVPIAEILLYR
ncbi:hypothetical protein EGT07_00780 [Herbaspirillum sp. HC18]|nr:hypothetical protein EGT07_00780 [Herbaspirillum sp. HC18]